MDLFWIIVSACGFFIFGFLATLMAVDNEDGIMQRAVVSGLLSSILFFFIMDIYDKI
tara:strand:- start:330 stop:500 length:171 start_codon:yes stop_codon:yes gene_type:complete